jgi:Uma2 family endonuclease
LAAALLSSAPMHQDRISSLAPRRHKLTVEEFCALADAGFFEGKGRFELIEGGVYMMSPLFSRHSDTARRIANLLEAAIDGAGLAHRVYAPLSLRLSEHSMPEPDIVVTRGSVDAFATAEDAVLVVEVSDASRAHDLGRKATLYARYDIAEYWVIDLRKNCIHQMTSPSSKGYAETVVHPFGARVEAKLVPSITLDSSRLA